MISRAIASGDRMKSIHPLAMAIAAAVGAWFDAVVRVPDWMCAGVAPALGGHRHRHVHQGAYVRQRTDGHRQCTDKTQYLFIEVLA